MSLLPPATQVEEMEPGSSNLVIRLQGRKREDDDERAGKLQLELLDRVEGILERMGKALSYDFHKLPAEVRELADSGGPGHLLQRLNLFMRDHILDDFLRKHPRCRQLFSELFSCRYPHLGALHREGSEDVVVVGGDTDRLMMSAEECPVGPLDEAFKSRISTATGNVRWVPIVKDNGDIENTVTLKKGTRTTSDSSNLAAKDALSECIDAYYRFDPLLDDSDPGGVSAITSSISLQELELAERMYRHMDALLSKESVDNVIRGVPNMAPQLKAALAERFVNVSSISQRFQKVFQNKVFAHMPMPAKSGIELEMALGRLDPEEQEQEHGDHGEGPVVGVELDSSESTNHRPGIPISPGDWQLQPYKGWYVDGPRVQLARAKNFLADGDIDRTVDWERKFAELTEYFAHLHSKFRGKDWIHDLRDALDMLRAHWIFDNYYYGKPQLVVDFPAGFWPAQSKRLPRLPGPDLVVCAESSERRDLTGPRRLLHVHVASAHDRQYEMPADVLRRDYLEPYWDDCDRFWAAGPFADATEPANLAACENESYEDCVSGGMAHTAKRLGGRGGFRPPRRSAGCHDGALQVRRETLEAFARFRGGKRAALQQCLNIFTHDENRKLCTPWRVLALPAPPERKRPDAGIFYSSKRLANPPEKESRDPWAYTRAYQWFKREELRWAQWAREHAVKESYGHKLWLRSGEPVMELPKNWKGPVPRDLMNLDMAKTYELLRRCQKIRQGLRRAARRAPRDFITGLLKAVDAGLAGKPAAKKMNLSFGGHEYEPTDDGLALANVRPTEAAWLEYICQPSRNRPHELKESLGRRGELMLSRVTQMMRDVSPVSLFRDTKPRTMDAFLKELNLGCRGPVKRYKFTGKDVERLAPKLQDLKILRVYKNERNGEWMFGRPETEFHPEDLVKWPDPEPQTQQIQEPEPLASYTSQIRPKGNNEKHHIRHDDDASVASNDTFSTHVSVPASSEDFHVYPRDMPRRKDVLSLRSFIKDPVRSPEWRERTANFFYCLGYRLGRTFRVLQGQHEEHQKALRDPGIQEHNRNFLDTIISYWEDDAKKRPNDPAKNRENKGSWRITMTFPDVVKIADPDAYRAHREAWALDEWPAWKDAYDVVRSSLLREAYENKTMLWPLHLPYNSYATRYKVADPTIWRKRLSERTLEIWNDDDLDSETKTARVKALGTQIRKEEEEEEKRQDGLAAQKQGLKTMRCEPVWTFGHPSRKKAVHLFWDMNNWPVHLQSESRRRVIASRGPAKRTPSGVPNDDDDGDGDVAMDGDGDAAAFAEELDEEAEMPYWKKAEQRRRFVPGRDEFWMGDTPLQRKAFEHRMKMRLAPGSRKRTWGGVLKTAMLGSSAQDRPAAASDEDLELSSLPAHLIPQSRPAKRRRLTGPQRKADEEEGRDLFAIARGESGGARPKPNAIPIHTRSTPFDRGEVTYYIPESGTQGKRAAGVMEGDDEPWIEYGMPAGESSA
ncbi:hypothetical protein Trco_002292 [Trichoderma cornu-damae]|uniref:Uncharacterized protein n=1 Tax=Trichoderma cornu-damae TaxID=654480 RepID=A0A9P8TUW7_9HYPO|nr:hypothetical protein Trco_002292 [Trichoderma cornu-damae]